VVRGELDTRAPQRTARAVAIPIHRCRNVLLPSVRASQITVHRSVVKIESSVIERSEVAMSAVESEVTISGGRIRGTIAIESSGSELDRAGTTLEGSESSLFAREGSTLLFCSVSRLERPEQQLFLHDVVKLSQGTRY
jgi:hypothetical protein